jgi:ABC-type transporter Mla MlaB component
MSNQRFSELKVYKKRAKRARWLKLKNLMYTKKKAIEKVGKCLGQKRKKEVTVKVPDIFSTSVDLETVLKIIYECKRVPGKEILLIVDFSDVEKVNAAALALLLSVVSDLYTLGVKVQCKMPINSLAKNEIEESGFLEHFTNHRGERILGKHKIFVKGRGKTEQQRIAMEIRAAMHTVYGEEDFNQPMQGAVVEMMANSVNHAFKKAGRRNTYFINELSKRKRWYLSVVHNYPEQKVYFTFVDNGFGLLRTIRRGFFSRLAQLLDDKSVLQKAFEGEYGSSTQQKERGQGLPTILSAFDKKAIRNLKIVSNGCSYSFENQLINNLTNFFEGTAYFWTLDKKCTYVNT